MLKEHHPVKVRDKVILNNLEDFFKGFSMHWETIGNVACGLKYCVMEY